LRLSPDYERFAPLIQVIYVTHRADSLRAYTRAKTRLVDLFTVVTPPGMLRTSPMEGRPAMPESTLQNATPAGVRAKYPRARKRHIATVRAFRWAMPTRRRVAPEGTEALQPTISHDSMMDSFRALWESLPLGIVLLGAHGDVLAANARAERVFGYDSGELPGKPVAALLPALQGKYASPSDDGLIAASDDLRFGSMRGLLAKRKNGSEFPV
jgi:PAS domain S-box-containing protein